MICIMNLALGTITNIRHLFGGRRVADTRASGVDILYYYAQAHIRGVAQYLLNCLMALFKELNILIVTFFILKLYKLRRNRGM